MGTKRVYDYRVEPQCVDFTLNATIEAIGNYLLNTAGTDARGKGFGMDVLAAQNRSWVLSRIAIEIDRRPAQYSEFKVNTWVHENNRLVSTRNFEALDSEGNIFCRSVSQWCLIDFEKRVPVNLAELEPVYAPHICDAPSPCEAPRKLRPTEPQTTVSHKVVYSDIDFNHHVNTMRYIVMMLDMLPIELLAENRPLRLDIHFIRECTLGQTLSVGYRQDENLSQFEIATDSGEVACRAAIEWR